MAPKLGNALAVVLLTGGLVAAAHGQSGTGPLAVEDRSVASGPDEEKAEGNRNDAVMMLMQELEQYQRETRKLRNRVEQLEHRLEKMREAQRERYLDLDTRLNALAEARTGEQSQAASGSGGSDEQGQDQARNAQADRQAYKAAKDKLVQRDFKAAAGAFQAYLEDFPEGEFRPYAHFWLGEVYRNMPDRNADARKHFRVVLDEHSGHSKVPAAMYKLATVHADSGNPGKARVMLEKLRMKFPDSREAELAKRMLSELDSSSSGNGDSG